MEIKDAASALSGLAFGAAPLGLLPGFRFQGFGLWVLGPWKAFGLLYSMSRWTAVQA